MPIESNQNQKQIIKNGETRGWIQIHPKLRVDVWICKYHVHKMATRNGKFIIVDGTWLFGDKACHGRQ